MDWNVAVIFGSITAIILLTGAHRYNERMELIRRGINPNIYREGLSIKKGGLDLLIGLVAIALGLGLILSAVLFFQECEREMETAGILLIFPGAALLAHWKITAPDREQARRLHEELLTKIS